MLIEYPDDKHFVCEQTFADKAYRKKVVEACQDPAVKSFGWMNSPTTPTVSTADALPAIQNKIGQFTGNR